MLLTALMAVAVPGWAQTDIVLHPASASTRAGKWSVVSDSSAVSGKAIRHANANAGKLTTALASPANYFELTFTATAGVPYRLWMHGKADSNYWGNDSVFVQFSGSVTSSGSAKYRIGTTSAAEMNLEDCSGCGLSGWKWQDNGWGNGVLGPTLYFATTGTQKIRVQTREDGLSLDQILLSPSKYLSASPSSTSTSTSTSSSSTATDIVLNAAAPSARAGKWSVVSDGSAIGDKAIRHPNGGAAKLDTALASPSNYFELTFSAVAGVPYRLWLHGKADSNYWGNDSVFVQFSGSVTSSGSAKYRIGTTSATEVNLEDCSGCGLSGWKWQDNGWGKGVLGSTIYFASTGTQKMRIQTREDGLSIDQIILSPSKYLSSAPTTAGSTSTTTTTESSTSDPVPSTSTGTLLKVLHWNTHHGLGTDGKYNIDRIATWIVKTGANVVSLNEVEKYVGSYGNEDQPARYASLLKAKTGKTWYYKFAQRDGGTNGQGNVILSTFPFEDTDAYELSYSRSVARGQFLVNGIRVNVFSTHLDADSSSRRTTQMKELISWSSSFAQQHILPGDYNAWPGAGEIINMTNVAYDAWAKAKAAGTAVAYSGNEAGNTRNSRIDYVFYSKKATRLYLKGARVFDTRDSNGVMPSDHRPLMATFEVK
jgi:endonuclease/exonuclease/phosphatase family metal-dependent hydrolase